jgi:hypothetical protein
MPIKFYKELETVINEWWDSLPEETKKDINKVYEKYEKKEDQEMNEMSKYEKIEWLHFAISEAINGNTGELTNALQIIEQLREPYLKENENE